MSHTDTAPPVCAACKGEGMVATQRCCGRAGYECCGDPIVDWQPCECQKPPVSDEQQDVKP